MKTLMILGSGLMQLPAFQAAKALGLQIIAVDLSRKTPAAPLADKFYCCDLADYDAILQIAETEKIDGIMTLAADYPVPAVAKVCEKLNLSGLSTTAAVSSVDKSRMRLALENANIPVPEWKAVSTLIQTMESIEQIGTPTIVKPADSSGGRGVTLIDKQTSSQEISTAFEQAVKYSRSGKVLVEEYVSGPEISVEALTSEGQTSVIAITDKLTSGKPFFVEVGHSQPTQLSLEQVQQIEVLVTAGVNALGIDNSPSHTEIRLGPNGPRIIEIGARLGGGYITSHLVPLSTGIDLVKASINIALAQPTCLEPIHHRGAAIRFFTPCPGEVTRLVGIDEVQKMGEVQELNINVKVGDVIEPLRNATNRIGHVIATGSDSKTAIQNVREACDSINIDTV